MDKINQLIKWCDAHNTRKEYILIKARLKMIRTLCEELSSLEDNRFVEEIIDSFSEILGIQQEIIDDMKMEYENLPMSAQTKMESSDDKFFVLPIDGFETEKEIVGAFSIYLEKTEEKQPTTIYDYCSRIRKQWKEFSNEEKPLNPLLSAYNNIDALINYVSKKKAAIEKEEGIKSPNFKNIANASASLNMFKKFKGKIAKENIDLDVIVNDIDIRPYLESFKIGQIANDVLRAIIKTGTIDGRLSEEDIERFKTERGIHSTFGLSLPLLSASPKDANGVIRYYKEPIICYGETLYLNSQWPISRKERLINWIGDWVDTHGGI
jgi:hypothetical protein